MESEVPRGRRALRRIVAELRAIAPAWIYLLLAFSLLRLTYVATLREHGVVNPPPSKVLIGSLLVAKALMTVDTLRLFPKLERRPVLVASLARTALYGTLVFAFQYVDVLLEHRRAGPAVGTRAFIGRFDSLRFWVLQIWMAVLLLGFSVTRTFARRLGRERFRRIMIGV